VYDICVYLCMYMYLYVFLAGWVAGWVNGCIISKYIYVCTRISICNNFALKVATISMLLKSIGLFLRI